MQLGTTINDAREQLYQYFAANWQEFVLVTIEAWGLTLPGLTGEPLVPFALGDEVFDPPDGPWVRVSVRHTTSSQETMGRIGNRRFERPGILTVQGFMPPETGEDVMDFVMECARAAFEGRKVGAAAIQFNAVTIQEIGVIDNGRWYASNAEAPFVYETIK